MPRVTVAILVGACDCRKKLAIFTAGSRHAALLREGVSILALSSTCHLHNTPGFLMVRMQTKASRLDGQGWDPNQVGSVSVFV